MNRLINHKVSVGLFISLAFIVLVSLISWTNFDGLPKAFQKKINKEIPQLWGMELLIKTKPLEEPIQSQLQQFGVESVFEVYTAEKSYGYVALAKARSKFEYFDYAIYYDQNKEIKAVRILLYREDYGGEIASKRWLKQFDGKDANSPLIIDEDIQGISGATISYLAITKGIKNITLLMNEI